MVRNGLLIAVVAGTALAQDVGKELAIGKQMAAEIQRRAEPLEIPEAEQYVYSLVRRLQPMLPAPLKITYNFQIVNDRNATSIDPLVCPGGFVLIRGSLFSAAEDEAEFAAGLAHSMAHVSAGHTVPQGLREGQIRLAFALHSHSQLFPLAFLPRMREFELQADRMAVKAITKAGFDFTAMEQYVRNRHPSAVSPLSKSERLQAIEAAVQRVSSHSSVVSSGEYLRVREAVLAEIHRHKRREPPPSLRPIQRRSPEP
jgi:predicted Zn-dependent protease